MPRRNFLWTMTGLISGMSLGAATGAAANQEIHAKKNDGSKSSDREQVQNDRTESLANKDSQPTTKLSSREQAENISKGAVTGAIFGTVGGYLVDEAFHSAAVASENDSNTFG